MKELPKICIIFGLIALPFSALAAMLLFLLTVPINKFIKPSEPIIITPTNVASLLIFIVLLLSYFVVEPKALDKLINYVPFLVFPIVSFFYRVPQRIVFYTIAAAALFASLYCMWVASPFATYTGLTGPLKMNPDYFAIWVVIGLLVVFVDGLESWGEWALNKKIGRGILFLFLFVVLMLLTSRMAFLSFAVIVGVASIVFAVKKKRWTILLLIPLIGILSYIGITNTKLATIRMNDLKTIFTYAVGKSSKRDIRWEIYDAAWESVKEKPLLGYGLGGAQESLNAKYKELSYNYPLKQNYNAHNQYFQFWLYAGILCPLLLICILLAPFFKLDRTIMISISGLFLMAMLTDSIVEEPRACILFALLFNNGK